MQKAVTVGKKTYRSRKKPNILLYAAPAMLILNNLHLTVGGGVLYTAILIACFCVAMFLNFQAVKFSSDLLISLIAIFVALFNTMVNGSGLGSFITFANLLLYVVFFSKVCINDREKGKVLTLMIASLAVTLVLFCNRNSVNSYYYSIVGSLTKERINANTMALLFFFTYVFVTMQITRAKKLRSKNRWHALIFLLFALLIYISDSRTALAVFMCFALVNWYNLRSKRRNRGKSRSGCNKGLNRFRKARVFGLCLIATLAFTFLYCSLFDVVGKGITIFGKNLFTGRQVVWQDAYSIIKDNWFFGYNNAYVFKFESMEMTSTHNSLLAIQFIFGIVPTLLFVWVIVRSFKKIISAGASTLTVAAIYCCLFIMTFETLLTDSNLYFYFVILFLLGGETSDTQKNPLLLVRRKAAQ